ncbi:protein translocase subunit SecD [Tistrella sp.]|uniref:protein translocase subunit SecD n=1 Tax=Tistrella sp. TaxID=2024861 RepID=UPI000C8E4B17|nr:protein translocase subunit SecD [Tistrella sp.]MAD36652.1 protein translocase subunit SecD [Tistrella sp.]
MLQFAKWKTALIIGICLIGVLFTAPNLIGRQTLDALPDWLPKQRLSLGLDLRGGSHLLLEVEMGAVPRERLASVADDVRSKLREDGTGYAAIGVDGDAIVVRARDAADAGKIADAMRGLNAGLDVSTDGGVIRATFTEAEIAHRRDQTLAQSIEVVRRRVDELGTRESSIQRQGDDRIIVQLPGVENPGEIKALLGTTAKMSFRLLDPTVSAAEVLSGGRLPPGSELLDGTGPGGQPTKYVVQRRVLVSGERLTDSQPSFQNNEPVVSFRFDSVGARRFGEATQQNVGRNLAIVLDDKVISAPVIREPILGGSGVISGTFTVQEANNLAVLLRAGALPAPLTVIEERTVGPDLGADAIARGEFASVLAFVLVIAFMALYYRRLGLYADVALLANLVLLLGALSALQATLTLPGIAGIVLTMGMAVDANVLIYERIREERAAGRSVIAAVEAGFKGAMTTIIDSNLTTLIAAALLFQFGSGPVKGFAVTLSIGILTTLFSAVFVTRLLVASWLHRARPKTLAL